MKNYGFIRIASACPLGRVGDVMYNTTEICNLIDQAVNQQVSLLVFPLAATRITLNIWYPTGMDMGCSYSVLFTSGSLSKA